MKLNKLKKKESNIYKEIIDARDIYINTCSNGTYHGLDVVVAFLAIENFYGKNNYGWHMYKKAYKNASSSFIEPNVFESMLLQYERFRHCQKVMIELNESVKIISGSCNVALGLYHNDFSLLCIISNKEYNFNFDIYWALMLFSSNEIEIILDKAREIESICSINFIGILWPPVKDYFDDIINDLRYFVDVKSYYDICFSEQAFASVIQGSYNIDDSTQDMIEKKITAMQGNTKKIRVVELYFANKNYRLKYVRPTCVEWVERKAVSKSVENLKAIIRKTYKEKIDYYFDIIIHMGDNIYQNTYMKSYFDFLRDFDKTKLKETIFQYGVKFSKSWENEYIVGESLSIYCYDTIVIKIIESVLYSCLGNDVLITDKTKEKSYIKKVCGYTLISIKVKWDEEN